MDVADRLEVVRAAIAEAALGVGRPVSSVQLVGVSKGYPAEAVENAVAAGLHDIGENRVQEAGPKIAAVNDAPVASPRWHLIGHLQRNKVKVAVGLFDTIQSVDSVRIAEAISRSASAPMPVFLEVQYQQTGERYGFDPELIADEVHRVEALPNIHVEGLMTVAPLGLDVEATRLVFRDLRERRDRIQALRPDHAPLELSMGMSADFRIAIQEGATVVRIGRAIFSS
jgi:pyridoxal phosphate enzyme (YggS family)